MSYLKICIVELERSASNVLQEIVDHNDIFTANIFGENLSCLDRLLDSLLCYVNEGEQSPKKFFLSSLLILLGSIFWVVVFAGTSIALTAKIFFDLLLMPLLICRAFMEFLENIYAYVEPVANPLKSCQLTVENPLRLRFQNPEIASQAFDALVASGFSPRQSLLMGSTLCITMRRVTFFQSQNLLRVVVMTLREMNLANPRGYWVFIDGVRLNTYPPQDIHMSAIKISYLRRKNILFTRTYA